MSDHLRIARADLDMPRGKAEVQFGHAIAMLIRTDCDAFREYLDGPQTKLSLEVASEHELEKIERRAALRHVRCIRVVDAGRTVFNEPTFTCIALGPMNRTDCNALTRQATMR